MNFRNSSSAQLLIALLTSFGTACAFDASSATDLGPESAPFEGASASGSSDLWINDSLYWGMPNIPICWADANGTAADRALMKSTIMAAWPANSRINFTGWGNCTGAEAGQFVKLFVEDDVTRKAGSCVYCDKNCDGRIDLTTPVASNAELQCIQFQQTAGPNNCDYNGDGIVDLSVSDKNGNHAIDYSDVAERNCADNYGWPHANKAEAHFTTTYLAQQNGFGGCLVGQAGHQLCMIEDATHELGHTLGFMHEQDRPDNAISCTDSISTSSGGTSAIGPWDVNSSMNYCSVHRANLGKMSFWDTIGTQEYYGAQFTQFSGPIGGLSPAVASNADGRMEVFSTSMTGKLVHQRQSYANGPFVNTWKDEGGSLISRPITAVNANGTIEVFATATDHSIFHLKQSAPNAAFSSSPIATWIKYDPGVGRNNDGRLEVFGCGGDNALHHRWQVSPGGAYSNWVALGIPCGGSPIVTNYADGRMALFVRSPSGEILHTWQVAPNSYFATPISLGANITMDPAVGRNADGRLEVFGIGFGQTMLHQWQTAPNSPSFSRGWTPMFGKQIWSAPPAVATTADGRMELMGVTTSGQLKHGWQLARNGIFTADAFSLSGRMATGSMSYEMAPGSSFNPRMAAIPAFGRNSDGRLEIFANTAPIDWSFYGFGTSTTHSILMHTFQTTRYLETMPSGDVMQDQVWK